MRAAVLDATIATLQECGYSGTSVRAIARRAGVSQGALQHHFSTKEALVSAALSELAAQLADHAVAKAPPVAADLINRCEHVLDTLWHIHNLPIARVVTELIVAARTDAGLRRSVDAGIGHAHAATVAISAQLLPELANRPCFADWILTCVATMRGLVITSLPDIAHEHSVTWPQARKLLIAAAAIT